MSFEVQLTRGAERQLRSIPRDTLRRMDSALVALEGNPRPRGVVRVRGREIEGWRIRIGDYRVLFTVDEEARLVTVFRIAHRRELYR